MNMNVTLKTVFEEEECMADFRKESKMKDDANDKLNLSTNGLLFKN